MKRKIKYIFLFLLMCVINIGAEYHELKLFVTIPMEQGAYPFEYSTGSYEGSSPRDISFIDGRKIFIAQVKNGIVFDISKNEVFDKLNFPKQDFGWNYRESYYFTYTNESILSWNLSPIYSRYDFQTHEIIQAQTYQNIKLLDSKPYYLHDSFFFYCADGKIGSITKDGVLQNTDATVKELLVLQKSIWYSSSLEKEKHERLIKTGIYLIVDGFFYPSVAKQAAEYFKEMGTSWDGAVMLNDQMIFSNTSRCHGVTYTGDFYYITANGMIIYNQMGQELGRLNTSVVNKLTGVKGEARNNISPFLYTVHPNGDFYALQSVKDDNAYFYRAVKTWGIDLIGMARNGIPENNSNAITKTVQGLSNQELRIIRNAFFALKGYFFNSWDLKCYFNGYPWYEPKSEVKSDVSLLNTDQKRLYDIITAEESRRKTELSQ